MNKVTLFALVSILVFLLSGLIWFKVYKPPQKLSNIQSNMELLSPAFQKDQHLPDKYSCKGLGINPPLKIAKVPENTQTLVMIMEDPDAIVGTFVHWLVWNISPGAEEIIEDSIPAEATVGTNSAGSQKFYPPCPPFGTHRYIFKLFALDTSLTLPAEAKKQDLDMVMEGHILDQTELIGLYP